ncbi:MAG: winged helix-turn-helix domain-containing protein [Phycisphaerales bacterium]
MPKGTKRDLLKGLPRGNWTDAQWESLLSPARVEILVLLEALREATAVELARGTGRSPDSLYPHLEALESCGLIAGRERTDEARVARAYSLTERAATSPVDTQRGAGMRRLGKAVEVNLRDAARRAIRYAEQAEGDPEIAGGYAFISEIGWLDAKGQTRFRALLAELKALFRESREDRDGERFFVGVQFFRDVSLPEHRVSKTASRRSRDRRKTPPE